MSEPVSFEDQIRPLFDQRDQEAMLVMFDLWDVEDVRENADAILEEVESGRMPCYGAWPPDRVELLRRWTRDGMAD
ncbi:MAG: hypothetical protein QOK21_47 [Solirubrobacteraceae bacterium]|jgi:hypothetical protein|nr:hypothetical protein [Solirubrobacteraceae bacterium]